MAQFENRERREFSVTEIRPGTYVFNDGTQVALGAAERTDCALTVLSRVISRHRENGHCRLILDAGKKVLTSDQRTDEEGFGTLLADPASMTPLPNARLHTLSEEHGWVRVKGETDLEVGDRVRIVPNHACVTVHTRDQMHVVDGSRVRETGSVHARGCTTEPGPSFEEGDATSVVLHA
jgi:D-serine deaminase-like pyridoxal phosphate-dependent protein